MGNIQTSQASVTDRLITDDSIQAALQKAKESNVRIVSWTIKNFTAKGDNYICIVTSVDIKYQLNGQESSASLIAKLGVPQSNDVLRECLDYAFLKECQIYEELIPLLNSELISLGHQRLRVPECYYAKCEGETQIMYLEDLRTRGFRTNERKKPLDQAHTTLVIKEMARLHASSLLLRRREGYDDLGLKFPILNKDLFDVTEGIQNMTTQFLNKHLEETIMILKEFEGYQKAVQWLTDLKPRAFQSWIEQLTSDTKFAVVCHGDCWNNNMLFRYDDQGTPVEVMLVDLQILRLCSLAVDLKVLFYHSLTGEERTINLNYYLDVYYESFKKVLEDGGLAIPFTRAELNEEYKSKHLYSCFWAMSWLPTLLSESEDIPDDNFSSQDHLTETEVSSSSIATKGTQGDSDPVEMSGKEKEALLLKFKKYPEMTSRFLSLFDDVIGNKDSIKDTA